MMAPTPPRFPADPSVLAFREAYPFGRANAVVATGKDGRYQGLIHVPEAHALTLETAATGPDRLHRPFPGDCLAYG